MQRSHLVMLLIAVTSVIADSALILIANQQPWPHPASIALVGLLLAQLSLLSLWFVWGPWNIVLRTLVLLALLWPLAMVMWVSVGEPVLRLYTAGLGCVATVAAPLALARLSGLDLQAPHPGNGGHRRRVGVPGRQFSVVALLSAVSSVALVLGVGRWLDLPVRDSIKLFSFAGAFGGMTLVSFVAAFRMPVPLALLVIGAVCAPAGFLVTLARFTVFEPQLMAVMTTLMGGGIAAGVFALRAVGFRLERPDPSQGP